MKIEPLIVVKDVQASSLFYQLVLGLSSAHGGDEYEMLMADDALVLQLHCSNVHEHPGLLQAEQRTGNGVALWFRTDEYALLVERILGSGAEIVAESHVNPLGRQHEIWFRDPDGYLIVVSDHYGDADAELSNPSS